MKPSTLLSALIAFFIISCNNENRSPAVSDTTEMIAQDTTFTATNPVIKKNTECYQFVRNKDTVSMKLNIEGEELTEISITNGLKRTGTPVHLRAR